jgi:hypothetical protein
MIRARQIPCYITAFYAIIGPCIWCFNEVINALAPQRLSNKGGEARWLDGAAKVVKTSPSNSVEAIFPMGSAPHKNGKIVCPATF